MSDIVHRLREASKTAQPIRFRAVAFPAGSPQSHECHLNVDQFVKANPEHRAVRGWLVAGMLQKHSVVAAPDGSLFDITPLPYRVPFFTHPGPEDEFWAVTDYLSLEISL